jgi:hypothetical protein
MRERSSSVQSSAVTSSPRLVSASASHVALVSTSSPRVSSVPIHRIAALMLRSASTVFQLQTVIPGSPSGSEQ